MVSRVVIVALVAVLSLALAAPVSAGARGGASHGGFHGSSVHRAGFLGGFHRHQGFSRFGCCFGPVLVGGAFLDAAEAAPYYDSPYPMYATPPPDEPPPAYQATPPPAPPVFCYVGGCYHLQGNGASVPYQWVWVPAPPATPPPPPAAPKI